MVDQDRSIVQNSEKDDALSSKNESDRLLFDLHLHSIFLATNRDLSAINQLLAAS